MSENRIGSNPYSLDTTVLPDSPEDKARQLPEPTGYKILVAIPEVDDKYDNGLLKADQTMRHEEVLATCIFRRQAWP